MSATIRIFYDQFAVKIGFSAFVFLSSVTGLLVLYHFYFQLLRTTKLGNKLPGFPPVPILGNALKFMNKNPKELMLLALNMVAGHKIFRVWFGTKLAVVLSDPRDVELVLGSNVHLEKSSEYRFFQPWLGNGLLVSKGNHWKSHRKMIAPTFHQSILKTFMPIFNKNANDLVQLFKQDVVGRVCDVHDYMSGTTVEVLMETVMGVKKTEAAESSFTYAKAVMDLCNIFHLRHYVLWLRLDFLFRFTKLFQQQVGYLKTIHGLTDKVIKDKKVDYFERKKRGDVSLYSAAVKETEEDSKISSTTEQGLSFGSALKDDLDVADDGVGEKKRLAFLDFMIEASQTEGNQLSDTDLRDEVNTIMFEGVYPEIQKKVYQEIDDIFQGSSRAVTFVDTLQMKYLERVLLETLRVYPPVPIITRYINEDIHLASENYVIPAGATVGIPQYLIHRDPENFPNPEKFDPDNFLPERCSQRHYYSFIPFSAGPRSCVGRKYAMLKLKVLLAHIVRNFKIRSVVSDKDFELQADIILKRADGFRVVLESRIKGNES